MFVMLKVPILLVAAMVLLGNVKHVKGGGNCECRKKVDLFFLLDESASIGSQQFERAREFLKEVVRRLCIGRKYSHIAVASFSKFFKIEINLSGDKTALLQKIDEIVYTGFSVTHLGPALKKLREMVSAQKRRRPPSVAVILTDGVPFNLDEMIEEAKNNHLFGLRTLTVSLGTPILPLLAYIASKPLEHHRFTLDDAINELELITQVVKYLCPDHGPGYCIVTGDPHVRQPDGMSAVDNGLCRYTLVTTCPADVTPKFNIEIENEMCGRGTLSNPVTCVKEVTLYVYETSIRMLRKGKVLVNGRHVFLPYSKTFAPGNWIEIDRKGRRPTVLLDFGLRLEYRGRNVYVTIPADFMNKICGLCGNFNGVKWDDYVLKDGTQLTVPRRRSKRSRSRVFKQVAMSWIVRQVGHEHEQCVFPNQSTVACAQLKDHEARGQCAPLQDVHGIFGECVQSLNISMRQDLFEDCVYDVCEGENRCNELEILVETCLLRNLQVSPDLKWRKLLDCPLRCGANSRYKRRMTACPASCIKPNAPESCPFADQEGCMCELGYLWEDDKCIPANECGCVDTAGETYYKLGDSWLTPHCRYKKTCTATDNPTQVDHECPSGKTCIQGQNEWVCVPENE